MSAYFNIDEIKNIVDIDAVNEAYKTFFPNSTPALRVVSVSASPKDDLIQIDVVVANEEGTPPIV